MKFLIAIGSKEYSEPTLRIGMQVANAFRASTTIGYVGQKLSAFSATDVLLARENMDRWEINRPGVDILEWAFLFLAEHGYITPQVIETGFRRNMLIEKSGKRCELYLQSTVCKDVNLILRNGDIIPELRDEVQAGGYDVTIIGGSKKRRMAHDLIQYIDSSILIVNQFDRDKLRRVLIPVDDSKGTKKAVKYGIRVAQAYQLPIDLLTVSKKNHFGEGYQRAAQWAEKIVRRAGIDYNSLFKVGDPVEVIKKEGGEDHIIVMGVSNMNPIIQFFKGSKPLKVMNECQCPILIVK